jgi:hypothetical protein
MNKEPDSPKVNASLDAYFAIQYVGFDPEAKLKDVQSFFNRASANNIKKTFKQKIENETAKGRYREAIKDDINKLEKYSFSSYKNFQEIKLNTIEQNIKNLFETYIYFLSFTQVHLEKMMDGKYRKDYEKTKKEALLETNKILFDLFQYLLDIAKLRTYTGSSPLSLLFLIYTVSDFFIQHIDDEKLKYAFIDQKLTAYSFICYDCCMNKNSSTTSNIQIETWEALHFPEMKIYPEKYPLFKYSKKGKNNFDIESLLQFFRIIQFFIHFNKINKVKDVEEMATALSEFFSKNNFDDVVNRLRKKQDDWTTQAVANKATYVSSELIACVFFCEKTIRKLMENPNSKKFIQGLINLTQYNAEFYASKLNVDLNDPVEMLFLLDTSPELYSCLLIPNNIEIFFGMLEPAQSSISNVTSPKNSSTYISSFVNNIYWMTSPSLWYKFFVSLFCPPQDEQPSAEENKPDSFVKNFMFGAFLEKIKSQCNAEDPENDEVSLASQAGWGKEIAYLKKQKNDEKSSHHSSSSLSSSILENTNTANSSTSSTVNISTIENTQDHSDLENINDDEGMPKMNKKLTKWLNRKNKAEARAQKNLSKAVVEVPPILYDGIRYRHIPNAQTHLPMYAGVSHLVRSEIERLCKEKGKDKMDHPRMTRPVGGQGIKGLSALEKTKVANYFDEKYAYKIKFLGNNGEIRILGRLVEFSDHPNKSFILFDQLVDHDLKPIKIKQFSLVPQFSAGQRNFVFEEGRRHRQATVRNQAVNNNPDSASNSSSSSVGYYNS